MIRQSAEHGRRKRFAHPRDLGARPHLTVAEEIERAEARLRVRQATRDRALLAGRDVSDAHLRAMAAEMKYLEGLRLRQAAMLPVHLTRADRRRARARQ
jgi:hypothetical protein